MLNSFLFKLQLLYVFASFIILSSSTVNDVSEIISLILNLLFKSLFHILIFFNSKSLLTLLSSNK